MKKVTLYHGALGRTIEVPESAVPIHVQSGWIPNDDRPTAVDESDDTPKAARKRRAQSTAATGAETNNDKESTDGDL